MNHIISHTKSINIMGLNFPLLDYPTCLDLFKHWIKDQEPHQVCVSNVHVVVSSLSDPELKKINNQSLIRKGLKKWQRCRKGLNTVKASAAK